MQPSPYHPLLAQQISQSFGDAVPSELQPFLAQINDTYTKHTDEQKHMSASVQLKTEQLIASTSSAYSFLDSLHMGLIMCDVNPEVVYANPSVRRILASKTADAVNQNQRLRIWTLDSITALMQPEIQLRELITKSMSSNQPVEYKPLSFGQYALRLIIAPMVSELSPSRRQIGAVVLVEDITEQAVLERAKDEFFFIASHELRTPLTAIRGNASMIKRYYGDSISNPDVNEMIDDIHASAIRLIGIVNDFLDVSALEQGKIQLNPTSFTLSEVVQDVVRELQGLSGQKGVVLTIDSGVAASPAVTGDKQRIKQVVYNLIGNAIKFTDAGSITTSTRQDDNFVYLSVADTGRGVPSEAQRLLFRKFQQAGESLLTRDTTRGTGLGLYISKLIIEQSGGRIGLEGSEIGKGSTFTFSLPRTKA